MIQRNIEQPNKRLLKVWAGMTDANYHIEVREQIAAYFGDNDRADFFREQIDKGEYTPYDLSIRCDVTHGMMDEIKEFYGTKMYQLIHECL